MNDILSAIGVILVFLTFLLGSIQTEITKILEEKKPEASQSAKIEIYKSRKRKILYLKSLPISIIFIVISYLLIPSCVKILKQSSFDIWDFDVLNTTFIFVELGLIGMSSFSIYKFVQLAKKE
ncbi:hypothetical protein SAMN05444671_1412 [Flavobacterium sp. CF108]|uniref:hypothetical protein n=1 Tax=unclassified Flavobacterium TaxID=196869 RepID=UPI0008B967F8|nr:MULTISPECIES: hypothetical protein [unclassified Flavobacterium]SEO79152.1 hypothetical protein SAMN04487978_3641 [Flavobacterium sp. fv08]SHG76416.1 hypothetical protein SAMN05444671_1412 [Flavobacterium sp. CF108]